MAPLTSPVERAIQQILLLQVLLGKGIEGSPLPQNFAKSPKPLSPSSLTSIKKMCLREKILKEKVLDYAPTQFQVKIKEGMYIDWEKPNLNKQLNHIATTLSI